MRRLCRGGRIGRAPSDAAFGRGQLQLLVVGLPIPAGLHALRAPANRSFGIALLILGVAWSLTALGEVSLSVPYTIGCAAAWFMLPSVFCPKSWGLD